MNTRIGLLVPSTNTVAEPDFYRSLLTSATVHTGRMYLRATTVEAEEEMLDEYTIPEARLLATAEPDFVVFSCTTAGALRGNAYDADLCGRITEVTGVPTISTIKSVQNRLKNAPGPRVAVLTPYVDELNQRIKASLEDDGLDVVAMHGLGLTHNPDIAVVSPSEIVAFARRSLGDKLDADSLFVSCTNFQAVDALPMLQQIYGPSVVTSNQATLEAVADVLRSGSEPRAT